VGPVSGGRLLLTGASGQLGSAVADAFRDWDLLPHTSASLDIADLAAVERVLAAARPDVVVNCAAFNDVDGAEDRPEIAMAVNAFAVRSLARACEACGATLVHYSTDFVFDGVAERPYVEADVPTPKSAYGASKLLGEWFALDAPRAFVLRVESLFGTLPGWTGRRGSLEAIVTGLERGDDVRVFSDRVVSPGYIHDIAAATRHLVGAAAPPGLYHCVNDGFATWEDIAREAARQLTIDPRLTAVPVDSVRFKASRPKYCALSTAKLAAAGYPMPHWREALGRWLASRGRARQTTS
jgi:dTDP-4-dehydrorhamnose reductase